MRVVCRCADDPRILVGNLVRFGWTWNFAQRRVWPAILPTVGIFFAPLSISPLPGIDSPALLGAIVISTLVVIMFFANRLARTLGPAFYSIKSG